MLCLRIGPLVDREAAGNFFAGEIWGRRKLRAKSQREGGRKAEKLCVCVCVFVVDGIEPKHTAANRPCHVHVPPCWSARTQGRQRGLHVGLRQTIRKINPPKLTPSWTMQR